MKPVTPQQWRHIVENYSEEFVTGTSSWPVCGEDEDRDRILKLRKNVTPKFYHKCVHESTKAWSDRPWESVSRSQIELRTYVGVIVNRLLVADGFVLGETVCRVEYVRSVASVVLDALLGSGRLRASDSGYEYPEKDVVRLWSWVLLESIPGEVEFAENTIIDDFLRSGISS